MVKIHCSACGRTLCETSGDVIIHCRRCGGINKYIFRTGKKEYTPRRTLSTSD